MHKTTFSHITALKKTYDLLRKGKESLLELLEESELAESVYNSNAIENSTLTLDETEKILLHQVIPPYHSQREVFEAINLAQVTEYLNKKVVDKSALTQELILLIHATLLSHIDDKVAGRFRVAGEYVRVGSHVAPAPEKIISIISQSLRDYQQDNINPLQRIISFHLEFEHLHPFCDGNGRVGRALINFQLKSNGYPPIIIRNKEKKYYYNALSEYDQSTSTKKLERILSMLIKESLHKRITYLKNDKITLLKEISKKQNKFSPQSLNNSAKKQSLPAFREKGKWKIGEEMFADWLKTH